jgi:hypothetical protein
MVSDPNGARITETSGGHELAATRITSLFYASIHYLSSLDPLFCFSSGYRQQVVGLRAALDGTWFVAVRSVTYPFLADQIEQERKIRGDLFRFVYTSRGHE